MSLSAALSNAASGLSAVTRSAELISNNVANALTEGYGRREIRLATNVTGGRGAGVEVAGVERVVNQIALNDRRLSEAEQGSAEQKARFYADLDQVLGSPDDPASLTGRLAAFESQLISAAAAPESEAQLSQAVSAADSVVGVMNRASDQIQLAREQADGRIAVKIDAVNSALSAVAELNDKIQIIYAGSGDASGFMDQRQQLIDDLAQLIPVKEVERDFGRIALISPNGTILVDGNAASFSFTSTGTIVPEMTIGSGALSGLTISGASSQAGTALDVIAGGSIAADFEIRDKLALDAQAEIDSFARELIERVNDTAVDPTLSAGPGLFTDDGGLFLPTDELGLAGRLAINAAVDPAQGGDVTRLRDGMEAATSGPSGSRAILTALINVFDGKDASGAPITTPISKDASDVLSSVATSRLIQDREAAFSIAQVEAFRSVEAGYGVDTDQEMQKLLLVEQSYAANAKVIQVIDDLLQSLLRI